MQSIRSFVQEAASARATGLRFGYHGASPTAKLSLEIFLGGVWKVHKSISLISFEGLLAEWLTDKDFEKLRAKQVISGWRSAGSIPVRYQIFLQPAQDLGTSQGFVQLSWHLEQATLMDWNLPSFLLEKFTRQPGLSLISGPSRSGKTSLLRLLAAKMLENKKHVLVFSDSQEFGDDRGILTLNSSSLLEAPHLDPETLLMVDSARPSVIQRAMRLAFDGHAVLLSHKGVSLSASFLELQKISGEQRELFWPLVGEIFVASLGVRLIPGMNHDVQPVFELLTDTSETMDALSKGSVQSLVDIMSRGGDTSGMRTLNQALLQLLIKRRIELRVGFDESPRPQELDELLKKVGV